MQEVVYIYSGVDIYVYNGVRGGARAQGGFRHEVAGQGEGGGAGGGWVWGCVWVVE